MVKLGKDETIWTRVEVNDKQLRKEAKAKSDEIIQEVSKRIGPDDLKVIGKGFHYQNLSSSQIWFERYITGILTVL
jgi:hypothetical protein